MKRLDSVHTEMLYNDVKRFVDAYNSWDEDKRELYFEDTAYVIRKALTTAVYVCGWRFNVETGKYEREENDA